MSGLNSQGPIGHERSGWDVFNPYSDAFHEAEKIFHEDLSKSKWHWRQAVVVIASIIGGFFFIVGAFPIFCWTAKALKPGENEKVDKVQQASDRFFLEKDKKGARRKEEGARRKEVMLPAILQERVEDARREEEEIIHPERVEDAGRGEEVPQETIPQEAIPQEIIPGEVEPEIPFIWKRESLVRDLKQEKDGNLPPTLPPQPPIPPSLWILEPNGQLDSKNPEAEKQFLRALQFLEKTPHWVNDEANAIQVKHLFTQLAKTHILRLGQLELILAVYQSILSQHEERFLKLLNNQENSLSVSLKIGDREAQVPKNLLISQSVVYQITLEGSFKKEEPLVDLGLGESEAFKEDLSQQFDNLISYFLKGEISIVSSNVLLLLHYADKNEIPHLKEGCLKFLASNFDIDNQESFSQVQGFIVERGLEALLTEEICRHLCGESFFGKAEWEKYYGDVGDTPDLPEGIEAVLTSDCQIFSGRKVYQTHMLVLVVEKVNGEPLTLESLGELVQNPKPESGGHADKYDDSYYLGFKRSRVPDVYKTTSIKSHWVLITKHTIPKSAKSYDIQEEMVENIRDSKAKSLYEVPSLRDMAICIFMLHTRSGICFFKNPNGGRKDDPVYSGMDRFDMIACMTSCLEKSTDGNPIVIGHLANKFLFFGGFRINGRSVHFGMAASRKL